MKASLVEEKAHLNKRAKKLIVDASLPFVDVEDSYGFLIEIKCTGFGHYYLGLMRDEADLAIYKELVEIDSLLGSSSSGQLYWCLQKTTRLDLIRVCKT